MQELLLLTLNGDRFAVRASEDLDVAYAEAVFQPPLGPEFVAGLTLFDNRTLVLADLAASLGLGSSKPLRSGHILRYASDSESGFLVEEPPQSCQVPPEALCSLPDYLKTPFVQHWVLLGQEAIALIDLQALQAHLWQTQEPVPAADRFHLAAVNAFKKGEVQLLSLSGVELAVPANWIESGCGLDGALSPLPGGADTLLGIGVFESRPFPVFSLASSLGVADGQHASQILILKSTEGLFGLVVDSLGERHAVTGKKILPMPPLGRVEGLERCVVIEDRIVPLVDPFALLGGMGVSGLEKAWSQLYAPANGPVERFGAEPLEVTEFTLLGTRYALPGDEVSNTLPLTAWLPLPLYPQILAGLCRHKGHIRPVLDLSVYFGQRLHKEICGFLEIANGDFQALVLAEQVLGKRILPADIQRDLPFALPHHMVYGCYIDGDEVVLVLNVHALTVYFTRTLARELFGYLKPEPDIEPVDVDAVPCEGENVLVDEALQTNDFPESVPAVLDTVDDKGPDLSPEPASPSEAVAEADEEIREPMSLPLRSAPDARSEVASYEVEKAARHPEEDPEPDDVPARTPPESVFAPTPEAVPESEIFANVDASHEAEPATDAPLETGRAAALFLADAADRVSEPEEDTGERQDSPSPQGISLDPEPSGEIASEPAVDETVENPLFEPRPFQPSSQDGYPEQASDEVSPPTFEENDGDMPPAGIFKIAEEPVGKGRRRSSPWVVWSALAVVCVGMVVAALSWRPSTPSSSIPSHKKAETASALMKSPESVEPNRPLAPEKVAVTPDSMAESPPWESAREQAPQPAPAPVPAEAVASVDSGGQGTRQTANELAPLPDNPLSDAAPGGEGGLYRIRKGDTLWNISRQHSGSPWRYRQLADDNAIENPDLIYPGQTIRLEENRKTE